MGYIVATIVALSVIVCMVLYAFHSAYIAGYMDGLEKKDENK